MKASLPTVKKGLTQIETFMRRVEKKAPSLTTRECESSPYGMIFQLRESTLAFLVHPEALDLFFELAPRIESFRGKGSQVLGDGIPEILQSILAETRYGFSLRASTPPKYTEEDITTALQKIASFALPRAKGDGKKIRSRRAAGLRGKYWDLLTDISEHQQIPDALALAKATAQNEKFSLPERSGAINYLLTELSLSSGQEDPASDPEIETIIDHLRSHPPSRDILFQILDHGVNSGQIDQMSALFDLEDFDEQN